MLYMTLDIIFAIIFYQLQMFKKLLFHATHGTSFLSEN